ncbi:hypothetical protein [uncultured Rubinisphaera sp.]|uniref:hypothetical protein n=1 Tax=uncultured Rubinisphaera sp. TaxID=1678686 RepID=UPI0030D811B5
MTENLEMSPERKYVIGMLRPRPLDAHTALQQRNQYLGNSNVQSADKETYLPKPYSPLQIKTILKERTKDTIPASDTNQNSEQADASSTTMRAALFVCIPVVVFLLKSCLHIQNHHQPSDSYRIVDNIKFPKAEPFNPTKNVTPGTNSKSLSPPVWTLTQDPRHHNAVKRIFHGTMPYDYSTVYSREVRKLKSSQSFGNLIQLMETSLKKRQKNLLLKIFMKKLTVDELDEYITAEKALVDSIERISSTQKNETLNLDDPVESLSQPVPEQSTTNP